ncbi:MAG: chemotaxis response regulator protein-glutamate methylesterase [Sphingobium sp.]
MRIAIVNDLPIATEALRRVVAMAPEHTVIWTACDGAEAIRRCAGDRPDLILMDLVMPGMDGVEATRRIMAESPCGILIVTASVDDNVAKTFAAMGHGALDAVDLPRLGVGNAEVSAQSLLKKIAALARLVGRNPASTPMRAAQVPPLVAIGASAGGPAALAAVLRAVPRDFPGGIIIVQHVDERFAPGMADWLNIHSARPVRIAREGDELHAGDVLLAGTGDHLVLRGEGRIGYSAVPAHEIYRPSINIFFQSICDVWPGQAVGVLLTGMGADGATGLKAMRDCGFHTIAQDSATSAVFGMPKAAAALSAAVEILPLDMIAGRIVNQIAASGRVRRT